MPEDHEFRHSLSEIMHDRSLPLGGSPVRVRQWLILQNEEDRRSLVPWLKNQGQQDRRQQTNRLSGRVDGCDVIWELHNEFSTLTAIRSGSAAQDEIAHISWLDRMPGSIFRSVEVLVGTEADFAWQDQVRFDATRLVSSFVFDRAARIWSDFTIKEGGGGLILVEDMGLQNDEVARLVQTLIEIGNYRKLALLGFPTARDLMPWITSLENDHETLIERHGSGEIDSGEMLAEMMRLSSLVERRSSKVRFRLGATNSYYQLTVDRLRSLRENRVEGYSTAAEFIERRLLPAMRTCEISQRRLETLYERINRTASLLSLEQTILLNQKNQAILTSLNRRSALQLRLQTLVEGFSIFAISYYIINILEKILKLPAHWIGISSKLDDVIAVLVIPVIFITWKILELTKKSKKLSYALPNGGRPA